MVTANIWWLLENNYVASKNKKNNNKKKQESAKKKECGTLHLFVGILPMCGNSVFCEHFVSLCLHKHKN